MSSHPRAPEYGEELPLVVASLLNLPQAVLVVGARRAGKTGLARAAFDDPAIATKFGSRRHWIVTDGVRKQSDFLAAVAASIDFPSAGPIRASVLEYLAQSPALLVFDDLDLTAAEDLITVDEFAADLARIPTTAILVTAPTPRAAFSIRWNSLIRLPEPSTAIAAEPENQRFVAQDAVGTDTALRHLLALFAALPDGASPELMEVVADADGAVERGRRAGVLIEINGRTRLVPHLCGPDGIAAAPPKSQREPVSRYLFALAERLAPAIGGQGGAQAVSALVNDARNIESAIRWGLDDDDPSAIGAAAAFANFMRHTGMINAPLVDDARALAKRLGLTDLEANCAVRVADFALSQFRHDEAVPLYNGAAALFRARSNRKGESSCYRNLGQIAFRRSSWLEAEGWFERSRDVSESGNDALGTANAIERLGDVKWAQDDAIEARRLLREALQRYKTAGHLQGQGNCWLSLGEIGVAYDDAAASECIEKALELHRAAGHRLGIANSLFMLGELELSQSKDGGADQFQEALGLFRALGNTKNQANCTLRLASVALAKDDSALADRLCREAALLYRRIGDLVGEAGVLFSVGDIALHEGRREQAQAAYAQALEVYQNFDDVFSMGVAYGRMAKAAVEQKTRRKYADQAASFWRRVNRPGLIDELEADLHNLPDART